MSDLTEDELKVALMKADLLLKTRQGAGKCRVPWR